MGGPGRTTVPGALVEAYAERYKNTLKEGALEAPLPETEEVEVMEVEDDDPKNPRPKWKK